MPFHKEPLYFGDDLTRRYGRMSEADYLRLFWPMLKPVITRYCSNPAHWPIMCSLALQQAIEVGQGRIDAEMAMRMALESALPMARIHADFS